MHRPAEGRHIIYDRCALDGHRRGVQHTLTDLRFPRVAALKTPDALRRHLSASGIALEFDDTLASPESSPLAAPLTVDGFTIGNRFCILPMEGWDGTTDGKA